MAAINSEASIYGSHVFGNRDDGISMVGCTSFNTGPSAVVPVVGDLGGPVNEIMDAGRSPVRTKSRLPQVMAGPPEPNTMISVINNNGGYGINLSNCVNVVVDSSYIGTDSSGTAAQPNAAGGIIITDSTGIRVRRCLVSGNGTNWAPGITIYSTQTPATCLSNYVTDCYIGTDITGTQLLPNSGYGVYLYNAADTFIGPTPTALSRTTSTAGANVITGNKYTEVNIGGTEATGNYVQGNVLGLDATATLPLDSGVGGVTVDSPGNFIEGNLIGTSATGVNISSGNNTTVRNNRITVIGAYNNAIALSDANNCVIGGPSWGDGNFLACDANNNGAAAWVYHVNAPGFAATNNTIRGNATFGPIVLDGARNANVPCGSTTGANLLLNYPVLTSAVTSSGATTIQGTLNSLATTTYFVDFYANTNSNLQAPAGQYYLGSTTVTTDGGCTGSFQFVVNTPAPLPAGEFVAATATDPNGNTSEFSAQLAVTGNATAAAVSLLAAATPTLVEPGGTVTYSLVLSNAGPADAGPVTVTDVLPAAVTFVSCNATGGGSCGGSGNNRTGTFSALPNGTSAMITFIATVSGTLTNGTEIDNFATASLGTPDPNPANGTAVAVAFAERQADLVLTQTATPEPVNAGSTLTYSLVVSNQGPDMATGVQLSDRLPLIAGFVSATASQGSCTQLGSVVSCNLSNLAAGHSATITLTVLPDFSGLITNATGVFANELDPNFSNNTATAISTVLTGATATATITVVANPLTGGTVSGGGIFTVGSAQVIAAHANTGWTFTGWSDGNAQNPRTITVTAGGTTYTTEFASAKTLVALPTVTPNGGTFTNSATVTLKCTTAGATIRYTTNGIPPTSASPIYKAALTLSSSVTLQAAAFKTKLANSAVASAAFTIIPPPPLAITTINLPAGKVKTKYSAAVAVTGGVPTFKWSWAAQKGSKLPPGLTLSATTGAITGKPTKAGTFNITVKVTDANKQTASQVLRLIITAGP